jgi:hypothetical protein
MILGASNKATLMMRGGGGPPHPSGTYLDSDHMYTVRAFSQTIIPPLFWQVIN